jgi:hypothetical protein
MATILQTPAILGKMIPDSVGVVTDIDRRWGTSDAIEKQDGKEKRFHKRV